MGATSGLLAKYEMNKLADVLRRLSPRDLPLTKEKLCRAMEQANFYVNKGAFDTIVAVMQDQNGEISLQKLNGLALTLATAGCILDGYDVLAFAMAQFQEGGNSSRIEHDAVLRFFTICSFEVPASLKRTTGESVSPGRFAMLLRSMKLF